jgi:aminopeptidase-like protein
MAGLRDSLADPSPADVAAQPETSTRDVATTAALAPRERFRGLSSPNPKSTPGSEYKLPSPRSGRQRLEWPVPAVVACDQDPHRFTPDTVVDPDRYSTDYRPGGPLFSMAIDWDTVPTPEALGEELVGLIRELFPIPRSLTGHGVRDTLAILAREVPLEIVETPTGVPMFDWVVPREWNLRAAWIEGPRGDRVLDLADSPLHVLGYSLPVDAVLPLDELRGHVFTHAEDPDLIPYRTSYWEERWGFCMSRRQLDSLEDGDYRVVIDATLEDGSLTSGELTIPGATDAEFLLSTYVCHPALANDNLSGVVLLWALARTLGRQRLTHTYRLLWSPGTLGPLCWLARNRERLDRVRHGLVVSCVGDPGPLRYKRSRRGDALVDRASAYVLARRTGSIVTDWQPSGGDERQYCSPGFDLPVGTLSRTPHGLFPQYHSSADDFSLVTAEALASSFRTALEIIDLVETNARYRNLSPYGEPQLGKRGLYQSVPDGTNPEAAYLWLLSLSDGSRDLLAIAERSGLPFESVRAAALTLEAHSLLERLS